MKLIYKGNVHEIYQLTDNELVFVKTDRISVHGKVLPVEIKDKGIILNKISNFWFHRTANIIKNHILEDKNENMPDYFKQEKFKDRTVIVEKLDIIPFEFIVRGYMYGRMWRAYQNEELFYNEKIDGKYKLAQKLNTPIITPTTKIDKIYDTNISIKEVENKIGKELTQQIINVSLKLYEQCGKYAYSKGLILADTKFEFGINNQNELVLADEIFTPDSSRFWEKSDYEIGKIPKSYDKQLLRDCLVNNSVKGIYQYDNIPLSIIKETENNYRKCMSKLLG